MPERQPWKTTLKSERACHVQIAAEGNRSQRIADHEDGLSWRVVALALTVDNECTVALHDGSEAVARWHLSAAGPLVLPEVALGWLQMREIVVHVVGDAAVSGTATLVRAKDEQKREAPAPAEPDYSEAYARGEPVPWGTDGTTRLVSAGGETPRPFDPGEATVVGEKP